MNLHSSIKNLKRCFLFLSVILFMACQSDDDQPQPEKTINGFWLAEDKGYLIEITDKKKVLYGVNSVGCTIIEDNFVPEESFGVSLNLVSPDKLIGVPELSASNIEFNRLSNQNEFCLPDQIANTKDPKVNFDHFWNIFNDYYAFFETRNVDWSQYKNLREQVTSENFYETLEELVFLLKDGHVAIDDEANNVAIDAGSPSLISRLNSGLSGDLIIESQEDYNMLYSQKLQTIVSKYLNNKVEVDENGKIAWGLIGSDIAYINILGMEGYASTAKNELETLNSVLDKIMNDLKKSAVSKLIIDVRFNGGGYDMVSVNIASRFLDQERLAFSKKARLGDGFTKSTSINVTPKGDFQFTGDIMLLTSPLTASAAEIFTLCMKDLPYVTIMGDNTNGVFSDILVHTLPNGASVGLSNEVYSDANGKIYEAIGVGPSEENRVPLFSNSDFIDEKDSGIDLATELLNK
ncbi:peptidase S41-like protein [Aquimarina sp. MAR_2010_214]|uniref:S41 family peptidase n=1 Tax=Aquimarina sp. MAR_2010_214 TaxID=1250026 RepID=UPI000CBCF19D|nr:S41 family peptidase [Aquimarina sp. MAR_2010_214]PKV48451.1 peptidase S41-like protein [Aquimarina sp. MAR_2010_214]